jgi:hypothetical protein
MIGGRCSAPSLPSRCSALSLPIPRETGWGEPRRNATEGDVALGVQVSSRGWRPGRQDGWNCALATATARVKKHVRTALRVLQFAPRTLRIRYTRPITPVNTGKGAAVGGPFTWLSVLRYIGPDRGAAASVAKAIAALTVLLATALRHVLGPRPRRPVLGERLWALLLHFRRRRRFGRRCLARVRRVLPALAVLALLLYSGLKANAMGILIY